MVRSTYRGRKSFSARPARLSPCQERCHSGKSSETNSYVSVELRGSGRGEDGVSSASSNANVEDGVGPTDGEAAGAVTDLLQIGHRNSGPLISSGTESG